MDITFPCFNCGQELTVDESGAGLTVPCPECGHNLTIPAPPAAKEVSETTQNPAESEIIPVLKLAQSAPSTVGRTGSPEPSETSSNKLTSPGRAVLDKLLKATEANDYDSFVADGTDVFKAALTKPMLDGVSAQLSPRMKKGYQCAYLGELSQQGCRVLLWKLVFKDGGDDTLAKLVLKDGKVAGFWLQ